MKTGINDSGVNLTQDKFLKIRIPVPDISVQETLVREVNGKLDLCKRVEEVINDSLIRAEKIRQSILKTVFQAGSTVNQLITR